MRPALFWLFRWLDGLTAHACNSVMQDERVVPKEQLEHDLRALGVAKGQAVRLHASVKAVGWVVGGPDTVLHALLNVLTPAGTLMMLASWEDNTYDLEHWPEAKREAYLASCPAFDPATSQADRREMGVFAE